MEHVTSVTEFMFLDITNKQKASSDDSKNSDDQLIIYPSVFQIINSANFSEVNAKTTKCVESLVKKRMISIS